MTSCMAFLTESSILPDNFLTAFTNALEYSTFISFQCPASSQNLIAVSITSFFRFTKIYFPSTIP